VREAPSSTPHPLSTEETPLGERIVSPSQCLLAIGLPLSREDFVAGIHEPGSYTRMHNVHTEAEAAEKWEGTKERPGYAKLAAFSLERVEEIRALGSHVLVTPSPARLAEDGQNFPVIALWTHASWPPLKPEDVHDQPGLTGSLLFGDSLPAETFRTWLKKQPAAAGIAQGEPAAIVAAFCQAVSDALTWWQGDKDELKGTDRSSLEFKVANELHRPEVDRVFSAFITPGRGIEMAGRMRGVKELFAPLARPETRIFDLRMCLSSLVFNAVKAQCNCLVAVNSWTLHPVPSLLRYLALLRALKDQARSYSDAGRHIASRK
jgi:hypothetical protein